MPSDYTVACYYFPNYHADVRNEAFHGKGWTEWELVKQARPRFSGHHQPKVPLWGYTDEADPAVMAQKIDAAADHSIDAFIFDWYWYDDGPFLERGLEQGFLKASNNDRLKFSIMWANHDWVDIHPAQYKATPKLLYPGQVSAVTFETMTDYIIENYFSHPSYWKIDGCPYFSVYELFRLVESLGGASATKEALEKFRLKTQQAGFKDLHINAVNWGVQILPNEKQLKDPAEMISYLGFDSTTSYVWVHHCQFDDFPVTLYEKQTADAIAYWYKAREEFNVPYFPNVTMGWDSTPRTVQSSPYDNIGYPYMSMLEGNSPERFQKALEAARIFLDETPASKGIFNINCWNEWTEGSFLEPEEKYGWGYLEAVKEVFKTDSDFNQ